MSAPALTEPSRRIIEKLSADWESFFGPEHREALDELVAAGLITSDGFFGRRSVTSPSRSSSSGAGRCAGASPGLRSFGTADRTHPGSAVAFRLCGQAESSTAASNAPPDKRHARRRSPRSPDESSSCRPSRVCNLPCKPRTCECPRRGTSEAHSQSGDHETSHVEDLGMMRIQTPAVAGRLVHRFSNVARRACPSPSSAPIWQSCTRVRWSWRWKTFPGARRNTSATRGRVRGRRRAQQLPAYWTLQETVHSPS